MKSILSEKYELQIITGNVVTGTNDSFTLATDEGQTYGVPTRNNFSVDVSQRVTVRWSGFFGQPPSLTSEAGHRP
jgi:hypothetical protein